MAQEMGRWALRGSSALMFGFSPSDAGAAGGERRGGYNAGERNARLLVQRGVMPKEKPQSIRPGPSLRMA
jgi:hypothetical protein